MTNLLLPLVGWSWGFAWIGFFILLCIVMAVLVFRYVLTGKSKEELEEEELEKSQRN